MPRLFLVTLLTDFGARDPYAGAVKGAILRHCPQAQIVDISHDVPAHDILSGAFVLAHAAGHFPPGTLHLAVVDPGVGADRRILAAQFGGQTFLFPDNGIITLVAEAMPLEAIATVTNTAYLPPASASRTFHGRDIFAPLAGQILNGLDIRSLGPPPGTFKMLNLPSPRGSGQGVVGQVIYVDRFGNLVSNIPASLVRQTWPDTDRLHVRCAGRDVGPLRGTYDLAAEGELLAVLNSMDLVEVAANRARACDLLQAGPTSEVRIGPA
jgi:hypothetical protein